MKYKNKSIYVYLLCFFSAIVSLAICSKCSPLYPLNDWVDINVFFTIGKGMVNGKILYTDLMDHKGPYVYAVAGIASIIDKNGFGGYFLLEIISLSMFLIYAKKTIDLYVNSEILCIIPVLAAGITASRSFVHGGSLEELCLGLFAYSFYSILQCFHMQENVKQDVLLKNGILAGIIFWSKFTMIGYYFSWIAMIFLYFLSRKSFKKALKSVCIFVCGMMIATIPWIIYFGANNAIGTWLKVYIVDNIFGYATQNDSNIIQKMIYAINITIREMKFRSNWGYSILVVLGSIGFLLAPKNKVNFLEKISVFFMGLLLSIGTYVGGNVQDYYNLPLAVFSILGLVVIAAIWNEIKINLPHKLKSYLESKRTVLYAYILILIISNSLAYEVSSNTYLLGVKKQDLPQYRFAEIIKKSDDISLLNYAFLDGGFYTVLQSVPQVRYFCTMNMNYSDIVQIQNGYLEQQLTNWVVTWKPTIVTEDELKEISVLKDYYQLVDYQFYYMEEDIRTYALYKKKE